MRFDLIVFLTLSLSVHNSKNFTSVLMVKDFHCITIHTLMIKKIRRGRAIQGDGLLQLTLRVQSLDGEDRLASEHLVKRESAIEAHMSDHLGGHQVVDLDVVDGVVGAERDDS